MCCSLYTITKNYLPKPYSKKARLFISLVNSLLLSGLAFYTTLYRYKSIDTLIKYESQQTWLADYTIGYFAADLFLGHLFDNTKFNFLTGYVHHITYIAMIYHARATNQSNIIYLFIPFEIPTFFLDLSRFRSNIYTNILFGITFPAFRIIYNLYLINQLWSYYIPYGLIVIGTLFMHIFWYTTWLAKFKTKYIEQPTRLYQDETMYP